MSLRIHNTLTNSLEEFKPIEPGKVRMYVCGVTVYDDIHMGHARSMIVFDMVARYLRYSGYEVTHVTNFTDVDDKIIARAAQEGVEPLELSARYIQKYFEDSARLGINRADIYPKASECIGDIISMVQRIIDNGYAYVAEDGSVYFDVAKMGGEGRLTNRTADQMQSSGRIAADPYKRSPQDFAVWKAAKPGEVSWDSPWGRGRPGWHIECSAMIYRYLGEQIDIHGGGNDLIFPHHENEILQTEAVTGKPLANYWMHNGMLQVKGHGMSKEEKMSKSLGNFFTVKDVLAKYDTRTVRFYFLNTHYMSPLIYGEDMLIEAGAALGRLTNNYRELQAYVRNAPEGAADRFPYFLRSRSPGDPLDAIDPALFRCNPQNPHSPEEPAVVLALATLYGSAAAQNLAAKKYLPGPPPTSRFGIGKEIFQFVYDPFLHRQMPTHVQVCSIRGTLGWPNPAQDEANLRDAHRFYLRAYALALGDYWGAHKEACTLNECASAFFDGFARKTEAMHWAYLRNRRDFDAFAPRLPRRYAFRLKRDFALWALSRAAETLPALREHFMDAVRDVFVKAQ